MPGDVGAVVCTEIAVLSLTPWRLAFSESLGYTTTDLCRLPSRQRVQLSAVPAISPISASALRAARWCHKYWSATNRGAIPRHQPLRILPPPGHSRPSISRYLGWSLPKTTRLADVSATAPVLLSWSHGTTGGFWRLAQQHRGAGKILACNGKARQRGDDLRPPGG